jgi:hypothetical protein
MWKTFLKRPLKTLKMDEMNPKNKSHSKIEWLRECAV